jgi:hypothetical protein
MWNGEVLHLSSAHRKKNKVYKLFIGNYFAFYVGSPHVTKISTAIALPSLLKRPKATKPAKEEEQHV